MTWREKYNNEQPGTSDEHDEVSEPSQCETAETEETTDTNSPENKRTDSIEVEDETARKLHELKLADNMKKPTSKKLLGLRHRIENVGKSIFEKTLHHQENFLKVRPTMIPPIPNSTFIDKFPDGMTLEGLNLAEKELQDGYEAEVKLYRHLEDLPEPALIFHGVEYTHDQCSAFLPNHVCSNMKCSKDIKPHPCHKVSKEVEGECDFILIGNNYVALFEVKGLHFTDKSDPYNAVRFQGSCEDALRQIKRIEEFVKGVCNDVQILKFIVFSNLCYEECMPLIGEESDSSKIFRNSLVFSDDLDSFNPWFDLKVTQNLSKVELDLSFLKEVLLGVCCFDIDNRYDIECCSLKNRVMGIDEKLRGALVTRRAVDQERLKQKANSGKKMVCKKRKNRKYPSNPRIIDAPELLRAHLNIKCLSKQQIEILNCDDKFVWIDGSAGSGKSIVMLGKILQIALNTNDRNDKVIIMVPDYLESCVSSYENYCQLLNGIKPGLCGAMSLEHWSEEEPRDIDYISRASLIKECSNNVILLNSGTPPYKSKRNQKNHLDSIRIISELCNIGGSYFVFFDDFQVGCLHSYLNQFSEPIDNNFPKIEEPIRKLKNLSKDKDCSVWIASDVVQQIDQNFLKSTSFAEIFSVISDRVKVLSINFRNSREISEISHLIRRKYFDFSHPVNEFGTSFVEEVESGHFIRGTKPNIFIVKSDGFNADANKLKILLTNELLKVAEKNRSVFNPTEIAILCTLDQRQYENTIMDVLNETGFWSSEEVDVMIRDPFSCHSLEWPVVVALLGYDIDLHSTTDFSLGQLEFLTAFYLTLSRATVHFSAVINVSGSIDQDSNVSFFNFLSEIESVSSGTVNFVTEVIEIMPMSEVSFTEWLAI